MDCRMKISNKLATRGQQQEMKDNEVLTDVVLCF